MGWGKVSIGRRKLSLGRVAGRLRFGAPLMAILALGCTTLGPPADVEGTTAPSFAIAFATPPSAPTIAPVDVPAAVTPAPQTSAGTPASQGAFSAAALALLAHVPGQVRNGCDEMDPLGLGSLARVRCQVPGVDGFVDYSQFDSHDSLGIDFGADFDTYSKLPDETTIGYGDCRTGPGHGTWFAGVERAGSFLCNAYARFGYDALVMAWSAEDGLVSGLLLINGETDYARLFDTWLTVRTAATQPPPVGEIQPGGTGWDATAIPYAELATLRFRFSCPPGGDAFSVWGTDVYTTDSSVCTAAVHAGLIGFEDGGDVVIVIGGTQTGFDASERNGVSTSAWGAYEHSFTFVAP